MQVVNALRIGSMLVPAFVVVGRMFALMRFARTRRGRNNKYGKNVGDDSGKDTRENNYEQPDQS